MGPSRSCWNGTIRKKLSTKNGTIVRNYLLAKELKNTNTLLKQGLNPFKILYLLKMSPKSSFTKFTPKKLVSSTYLV